MTERMFLFLPETYSKNSVCKTQQANHNNKITNLRMRATVYHWKDQRRSPYRRICISIDRSWSFIPITSERSEPNVERAHAQLSTSHRPLSPSLLRRQKPHHTGPPATLKPSCIPVSDACPVFIASDTGSAVR